MAEKSFGIKEINLIGASGTPTIESPNNLNLNAINVAISTNVSIGGTLTVTGNVSVGGTLTYEDVTNIDSVGIITARSDIKVGTSVTITSAGAGFYAGIVTASNFVKIDGSSLGGGAAGLSTDVYGNTFGGYLAGNALTSGNDDNVIIGREAGEALNSGDDNVFIGAHAGEAATSISQSILIGYKAGSTGQTGSRNVIIGDMNFNSNNNDELLKCTFVGYGAGSNLQDSYNEYNTFIGYGAGQSSGADYDVCIGRNANNRGSGRYGIFIGDMVGNPYGTYGDMSGQENIMIGRSAGGAYTSGGNNTLMGSQCGGTLTTGSNNLVLGHDADVSGATVSNEITLGDANITKFRIPGINVVLKDNGGTPTEGHVLTVDGSGEASFVGITTSSPVTNFVVTANGSSAYRFAGGGVDASEDNPDLFLEKGVKYRFDNTTGSSHPFAFRVSNGGSAYTNGITGSQNGVQFFTVPYDAPDVLAYQCTIHGGMVGNIWTYAKTTQCYDIYRLAANYTIPASDTTVTETMVRPTLFFEKIGPGMSVSSGVFTFPSTGKYEIQAFFQGFQSNGNDNIFKFNMDATADNSNWQEVVNCRAGNYNSGRAFSATFTYLIDITNTSTHKVRFGTTTAGSNRVQLDGNSASNILDGTYFVFKKVGDT